MRWSHSQQLWSLCPCPISSQTKIHHFAYSIFSIRNSVKFSNSDFLKSRNGGSCFPLLPSSTFLTLLTFGFMVFILLSGFFHISYSDISPSFYVYECWHLLYGVKMITCISQWIILHWYYLFRLTTWITKMLVIWWLKIFHFILRESTETDYLS